MVLAIAARSPQSPQRFDQLRTGHRSDFRTGHHLRVIWAPRLGRQASAARKTEMIAEAKFGTVLARSVIPAGASSPCCRRVFVAVPGWLWRADDRAASVAAQSHRWPGSRPRATSAGRGAKICSPLAHRPPTTEARSRCQSAASRASNAQRSRTPAVEAKRLKPQGLDAFTTARGRVRESRSSTSQPPQHPGGRSWRPSRPPASPKQKSPTASRIQHHWQRSATRLSGQH